MNRREFLQILSYTSAWSAFLPLASWAQGQITNLTLPDHFMVMLYPGDFVATGMDCLLGLDPRLPNDPESKHVHLGYKEDSLIRVGTKKNGAPLLLGPCAHPLAEHFKDICIINGIMMRQDLGHDSGVKYMIGGGAESGVVFEVGKNETNWPYQIAISLNGLSNPGLSTLDKKEFQTLQSANSVDQSHLQLLASLKGQTALQVAARNRLNHNDRLNRARSLRSTDYYSAFSHDEIIKILSLGLCNTALFGLASSDQNRFFTGMDSHSEHDNVHPPAQLSYWQTVANLFQQFKNTPYKSSNLFDHTTFFAFNEFSRTPKLNGMNGKDHNPYTNSCLLAGKGIKGGQVVGASRAIPNSRFDISQLDTLHIARPMDYSTGHAISDEQILQLADTDPKDQEKRLELINNLSFVFPENVVQTIAGCMNIKLPETHPARKAKIIPGVLSY